MENTTKTRRIALIPGDGIGAEVAASARAVLAALDSRHNLGLRIDEFDWSASATSTRAPSCLPTDWPHCAGTTPSC